MSGRAKRLITQLGLKPHPEGGYYGELYRSSSSVAPADGRGERRALTSIYFLLPAGAVSRWHRVQSDEVWHFYEGAPLELWIGSPSGDRIDCQRLGPLEDGQQPVGTVPAGWWQAARPTGSYTLVGCTVGPGFDFRDFVLAVDTPSAPAALRTAGPGLFALVWLMLACGPDRQPPPRVADPPPPSSEPIAPASRSPVPRIGLAVTDTLGQWCAEFVIDSTADPLAAGQPVTLLFPGDAPVPSLRGRLDSRQAQECPSAFPQPRWADYEAIRMARIDSLPSGVASPAVALVVTGHQQWSVGAGGAVRGDLDGDGQLEEARRCTADEGEHLTVWSFGPDGKPVRRWHEHHDWGGFTDPTCRPEEMGP